MKKIFNIIMFCSVFSILIPQVSLAQRHGGVSNIRQLKYEMVLQEMSLDKAKEGRFMPLYSKYCDEVWNVKKKIRDIDRSGSSPQQKIQQREQYKQQLLDIEKRYKGQFLKIISPAELDRMYNGEDKFRKKLLELRK